MILKGMWLVCYRFFSINVRFTLINLIKEVLTGIGMMSHRKLLPPTNIRRTLSNRKATPLSLTGEVSRVCNMYIVYNPVVQDIHL